MRIGNRANMTITKARMSRMAKTRVLTGRKKNYSQIAKLSGKNSSVSGLLQNLDETNKGSISQTLVENQKQTYNYEITRQAAKQVKGCMENLSSEGETSIFGKEDGAREKASAEIKSFVSNYNVMIGKLNGSNDTSDIYYTKKLDSIISKYSSALREAGITQDEKGFLKVDEKKLKEANTDQLKKLFGAKDGLCSKVAKQAESIEKNADKRIEELKKSSYQASLNYTRYGTSASYGYSGSWYNTKG